MRSSPPQKVRKLSADLTDRSGLQSIVPFHSNSDTQSGFPVGEGLREAYECPMGIEWIKCWFLVWKPTFQQDPQASEKNKMNARLRDVHDGTSSMAQEPLVAVADPVVCVHPESLSKIK